MNALLPVCAIVGVAAYVAASTRPEARRAPAAHALVGLGLATALMAAFGVDVRVEPLALGASALLGASWGGTAGTARERQRTFFAAVAALSVLMAWRYEWWLAPLALFAATVAAVVLAARGVAGERPQGRPRR